MQIDSDICKSVNIIVGGLVICYLTKLAIDNNLEPTFQYKESSFSLKNNSQLTNTSIEEHNNQNATDNNSFVK